MTARARISAIALTVVTAAAALGAPSPAMAGNNGQQVRICASNERLSYGFAVVTGFNQNAQGAISPWLRLPLDLSGGNYAAPGACVELLGWWWIGDIRINFYESNRNFFRQTTCNVPKWNPFDDFRRCG